MVPLQPYHKRKQERGGWGNVINSKDHGIYGLQGHAARLDPQLLLKMLFLYKNVFQDVKNIRIYLQNKSSLHPGVGVGENGSLPPTTP